MKRSCSFRFVDFGSLKALVTVQLEELEIRGFKVIDQGQGKTWVAPPSREIVRDGKKEYFDVVRFIDEDARREFNGWILTAYRAEAGGAPKTAVAVASGNGGNGGSGGNGGHGRR
ncbi:MAG: SpoVG family protein [Planctomycetes bacterium]|jgi:DNA-binding cell septation regulator SpoVG|nr:SpoVG family protein [Planctomycetota bacterium]